MDSASESRAGVETQGGRPTPLAGDPVADVPRLHGLPVLLGRLRSRAGDLRLGDRERRRPARACPPRREAYRTAKRRQRQRPLSGSGRCAPLMGLSGAPPAACNPRTRQYPGTFTETGSAALAGGNVTALHVSFTIDSPSTSTTITGTKDLVLGAGSCELLAGSPVQVPVYQTDAQVTYTAILHRAQGALADSGNGFFSLEADAPGATIPTIFFDETFDTSNAVLPADKNACKNGGYRDFPQFKNQGDCVSFVTTGGKNPPSGG